MTIDIRRQEFIAALGGAVVAFFADDPLGFG